MMRAPRAPKGEKPSTTIRILRRQLSIAQATIQALQMDRSDKEKVIAGYDVQLSEAQDEAASWQLTAQGQAEEIGKMQTAIRADTRRLAYLEGYFYAKETIPAPSSPIAGDQPETNAGRRQGNQESIPTRRQRSESQGLDQGTARLSPRPG